MHSTRSRSNIISGSSRRPLSGPITGRIRRRWLPAALLAMAIWMMAGVETRAQVNTEALRREAPVDGFENRIGLNVELHSGNSDYHKIGANYRLDYLSGPLYSFIVGSYERGSGGGELFLNDAFIHARVTWGLDSTWRLEAFAQKEFNDFIRLRDRDLAGGGVRVTLLSVRDSGASFSAHLGVGAMFESELQADTVEARTNLLRSTNYLNVTWHITKLLHLAATGYYQIAPAREQDYRVLAECGLRVDISDLLSLDTGVRYRFDNAPPAGVKRYDLHLSNGLGIRF